MQLLLQCQTSCTVTLKSNFEMKGHDRDTRFKDWVHQTELHTWQVNDMFRQLNAACY